MLAINKNQLKAQIDSLDEQYLEVIYQLIEKLSRQKTAKTQPETDFKRFLLNMPKLDEGLEIERRHDYPKDIEL